MGEDACLNPTGDYCAPNVVARFDVEIDCYISTQCKCLHEQAHLDTLYSFVPYLYPFTIEFNIPPKKNLFLLFQFSIDKDVSVSPIQNLCIIHFMNIPKQQHPLIITLYRFQG